MIQLLKEVARGKRGARDLTYDEAVLAAEAILTQEATQAQTGAFFIAERIKMESVDELEAFVRVSRKHARRAEGLGIGLDCAGPYDGRKTSFYATFPTAFLLAAAGLPNALHGTASLPPKWGITLQDIVESVGIAAADLTPERTLRAFERSGVFFASTEQWCPPLGRLRQIREELGMRTVLNSAEKLLDLAASPRIVFGVYHNTVFDRLARLFIKLGYEQALIVQGAEGSEDLYINRPTRAYLVENGEFRLQIFDPETYGIEAEPPERTWTPADQLAVAEAVLRGDADLAYTNQALFNGAVRLQLAGKAESVEQGLYACKALLDGGEAHAAYLSWRTALLEPMGTVPETAASR
ncbi:anthranilate phosphoribosyltransferase [Cohnella sp. OV330]|uniref:anthranilate phosphoribosyltransferase n=1 Tax=Cohnella sp. OV330 TaxID=1855288 RepID=UPI0008E78FF5|nr:anthranilate phosphoribosyltransferase [Cohnella sp. OV330]SFB61847.1 anthranilate phosphoribosyltransferase [Cohnella sp. OV330]